MGARGPQYAKFASELIKEAFEEGYKKAEKDVYYKKLKCGGNYTVEASWKYSSIWYSWRDVKKQEEQGNIIYP